MAHNSIWTKKGYNRTCSGAPFETKANYLVTLFFCWVEAICIMFKLKSILYIKRKMVALQIDHAASHCAEAETSATTRSAKKCNNRIWKAECDRDQTSDRGRCVSRRSAHLSDVIFRQRKQRNKICGTHYWFTDWELAHSCRAEQRAHEQFVINV